MGGSYIWRFIQFSGEMQSFNATLTVCNAICLWDSFWEYLYFAGAGCVCPGDSVNKSSTLHIIKIGFQLYFVNQQQACH